MKELYARLMVESKDNTERRVFGKVLDIKGTTVTLQFENVVEPTEVHASMLICYCDIRGHAIQTIAEECLMLFNQNNEPNNDYHMFEICFDECNKLKSMFYCKTSDYTFYVSPKDDKNTSVKISDGNGNLVEEFIVGGAYAFMHLLDRHNMENSHNKFIKTKYLIPVTITDEDANDYRKSHYNY